MEKKKQKPYSEYEKQLLIQLVQSKIGVVENRKTDGVSQKKKHEAWEEITTQFNNSNVSQTADTKQLKKMWQNLKTKARDAKTLEAQRKRTGGGPAPPEMGPLESQIMAVMPNVMPSIDVPIDSDTPAAASTGLDNDEESWLPKRARREIYDVDVEIENVTFEYLNEPGTSQEQDNNQHGEDTARQEPNQDMINVPTGNTKKKKSFDDIKKDLLWQELQNNKTKFKIEMEHAQEKHKLEIEFLKEKYKLELEILNLKKEKLLEK